MRVEAVTVSCHYSDFLREVAPYNKNLFDRWLIVTSPDDIETREVCRQFNLEYLQTNDGNTYGTFAKGRMIERGLQQLSADTFILQLDSDIVCPADLRASLEAAEIQENCIYGADRVMIHSYEDWLKVKNSGWLYNRRNYHHRLQWPEGFQVSRRWVDSSGAYGIPGYFQLFHSSAVEFRGTRIRPYPHRHGNACRGDIQMSCTFDRPFRHLLPEVVVLHLESEQLPLGSNWKGRTSKYFGIPKPKKPYVKIE